MFRKWAYKKVLNDLKKYRMFCGKYDAKNGNVHFMYGVQTVMEYIASQVSRECCDKFDNEFINNLLESEDKVK